MTFNQSLPALPTWKIEGRRRRLVRLLWVYFGLLIFEGALRKWVLPAFADPLLIVRDPVAALIIVFAVADGYLPLRGRMGGLPLLCLSFVILGGLQATITPEGSALVLLYGLRTYFLHLPLIFIMPRVLTARDLRAMLVTVLVLALPVAVLMAEQFRSSPNDWINRGAGEGRTQIYTSLGRIRPAGPFSFISGPIQFYALALACLIGAHFSSARGLIAIRFIGWAGLLLAAAVSGSRSLVAGLAPITIAFAAALLVVPRLSAGVIRMGASVTAVGMVIWTLGIVREGVDLFNVRLEEAGGATEIFERSGIPYNDALIAMAEAPMLGVGLGVGTNAASALLGIQPFAVGETEWRRIVFEAGPILGTAYLVWRCWLVWTLFRHAYRAALLNNVLPLVFAGAASLNILIGQWGQPTTQGFSIWIAGLTLTACQQTMAAAHWTRAAAASAKEPERIVA